MTREPRKLKLPRLLPSFKASWTPGVAEGGIAVPPQKPELLTGAFTAPFVLHDACLWGCLFYPLKSHLTAHVYV